MSVLYVQQQGAVLRKSGGRLEVVHGGETHGHAHLRDLERVVLMGAVEVTTPAMAALLDGGIELLLLSAGGRVRGRLTPAESRNVLLRRDQFLRHGDTEYRLRAARRIVSGKIRNARSVVQRFGRNHPEIAVGQVVDDLDRSRTRLDQQQDAAAVLGVEGDAARVYFSAFGQMLLGDFAFTVRTRRPPLDPANSLLSLGYALVEGEITGALMAEGLDPMVGLLHELDYGRPSLALDLLEEFRQPIVDRLTLSLVNNRIMRAEHFEESEGRGVRLSAAGRKSYLPQFHRLMDTEFLERASGERTTFRRIIRRQAHVMRVALAQAGEYEPYAHR